MTNVGIRDFTRNFFKWMGKLPIIITKHKKPIAKVIPIKEYERGKE